MRKTVLFIAVSLDGYIADKNGGVGWLSGQSSENSRYDPYSEFIKNIDTVIMGRKTYSQIITELSPGKWVYEGLKSFVITHSAPASSGDVEFTSENPKALVDRLKKVSGKDIWICGGAETARQLIKEDMIDVYHISIIPTILGTGLRLFGTSEMEIKLKLIKSSNYNGIAELIYERMDKTPQNR